MSVYLDTNTDTLRATLSTPLTFGTSIISVGMWIKPITDPNAARMFARIWNASTGFGVGFGTNSSGDFIHGLALGGTGVGDYAFTNGVWYWAVVDRDNGSLAQFRIFADSVSTTPIVAAETLADTTNYTSVDDIYLGDDGDGTTGYVCEVTCLKVHTGVQWSNTECRTESQKFDIQTAGGTNRLAWGMETIDANSFGLNERGGETTLTNSGVVNGASRPSQLESAGGGGGTSTRSPGKISSLGRTPMAIRPSTSNRIVIS
jgi:hypothetical protein